MKCLFIINPSSGTHAFQKSIDQFIGQLILHTNVNTIDTYFTRGKNDGLERAARLTKNEYDFIVAVGGDGTINEIITGLIKSETTKAVHAVVNFLVVFILSASFIAYAPNYISKINDFSADTPEAFRDMIARFKTKKIDAGYVDDHCFANVLSGGMFSDIGFLVTKEEKKKFGPLAYYINGLKMLPEQLGLSLHLKIKADEIEFEEDAALFMITNSSHVGGFPGVTPYASTSDGKLDLIIIKKGNVAELLNVFMDYKRNLHPQNPMIRYVQAKDITISCDEDIVYDIDGEKGQSFPVHVECLRHAVSLIIPDQDEK